MTTVVTRSVAATAVAISAMGTASVAHPGEAQAAASSGWALADRDHEGKVYGAGVLDHCGVSASNVDVDGNATASAGGDCRTRPCAFSTGGVANPPGQHSWCVDTLFTWIGIEGTVTERIQGNCISP